MGGRRRVRLSPTRAVFNINAAPSKKNELKESKEWARVTASASSPTGQAKEVRYTDAFRKRMVLPSNYTPSASSYHPSLSPSLASSTMSTGTNLSPMMGNTSTPSLLSLSSMGMKELRGCLGREVGHWCEYSASTKIVELTVRIVGRVQVASVGNQRPKHSDQGVSYHHVLGFHDWRPRILRTAR